MSQDALGALSGGSERGDEYLVKSLGNALRREELELDLVEGGSLEVEADQAVADAFRYRHQHVLRCERLCFRWEQASHLVTLVLECPRQSTVPDHGLINEVATGQRRTVDRRQWEDPKGRRELRRRYSLEISDSGACHTSDECIGIGVELGSVFVAQVEPHESRSAN